MFLNHTLLSLPLLFLLDGPFLPTASGLSLMTDHMTRGLLQGAETNYDFLDWHRDSAPGEQCLGHSRCTITVVPPRRCFQSETGKLDFTLSV